MRTPIDRPVGDNEQTVLDRPLAARYEVGAVLCGKYRLEALLGEGGMGAVWRACNVLLDLPVALKLIRADLDRGTLRARLQLEARSAAKLGHPSIVRVFDVGESELGDPFIVMEHLHGETLAQLLSRGRVAPTRAVQLLLPIIDALAVAHARGIVHRDLKPDNLMLTLEEQHVCPKILDFGIAKLTNPCDADHKLTEFGAVIGSPEYMSPEQARGRDDIDASTDIWSTCVVLYEAVTGSPPFSASNCNALLRSIVEDAPKPLSERGVDEPELWQILERGLHKDRAQRYDGIAQLGRALAVWLAARGVYEDARGTTLDSKWLHRESDRSSAKETDETARGNATPEPLLPNQESVPDSTGIVRGPFTNTIAPGNPKRARSARTLAATLGACAVLAVPVLFLVRQPRANAVARAHMVASNPSPTALPMPLATGTESPPSSPAPLGTTAESPPSPPARPEHLDNAESDAPASTRTERKFKPPFSPARVPPATKAALAVSAVVAPAAKPDRPLDLLPPY
ncbi:MAG TPA: protein kinase [Polyangiaceae bacterium]|nr:protein kinase [Polyangiaceae bacterium]